MGVVPVTRSPGPSKAFALSPGATSGFPPSFVGSCLGRRRRPAWSVRATGAPASTWLLADLGQPFHSLTRHSSGDFFYINLYSPNFIMGRLTLP